MLTQPILHKVLQKIDHAIIIADKDGNFTMWNDAAQRILGMKPDIKAHGVWSEHFLINKFNANGDPYKNEELPIMRALKGIDVRKEKLYISSPVHQMGSFLEVDAFPIRDDDENIIGAVASFNDITNNIKMEKMVDELTHTFNHMKDLIEQSFFIK